MDEGDVLDGLNLLPGLQLGGKGRSRGRGRSRGSRSTARGRSRGGRSRARGRSRGGTRTRASRGKSAPGRGGRLLDEEEPPAQSELQHHTALLADPETGEDGQLASLLALQALEVP